ncbi:MAG: DUF4147 domain-containing protein [Pyrinomonadaceae bacterium]|nr:DUF4147 domain-containing protein [Pyrinomonadaceae bacterium]
MTTTHQLRRHAREIFTSALEAVDPAKALRRAVHLDEHLLTILGEDFDLRQYKAIYSIALGKASGAMAAALDRLLDTKLAGGIISSSVDVSLPARWRRFAGGHPVPNEESFAAAQACFDLLNQIEQDASLIIFLISGGGSAMMEIPRDEFVTLADVQEANRLLVNCGASIGEINAVRQAFSKVKAGGLSHAAWRAAQVTLIVSDTNAGEESNAASGPTFDQHSDAKAALAVIAKYNLERRLPQSITETIKRFAPLPPIATSPIRRHYVLLDNRDAIDAAAQAARERGFRIALAEEIVEQPIEEGCAQLVSRLIELRQQIKPGETVCLISGGEFACPVRGNGIGGRNCETALRCATEIGKALAGETHPTDSSIVALSAGTDGIDGNSPAAGAIADETTLKRALKLNLDPETFLYNSDAYNFFRLLNSEILTGATGTNVRDLRIMLATQNRI